MVGLLFGVFANANANATTLVNVNLRISAGGYSGALKECTSITVPAGSGGNVVLDAAVQQGCLRSYQTTDGGGYVTCIDPNIAPVPAEICEQAGGLATFWAYYKDGATQQTGIASFDAHEGDEIAFAYTNFGLCPTYPSCPL